VYLQLFKAAALDFIHPNDCALETLAYAFRIHDRF
jgi:hypothetical protein